MHEPKPGDMAKDAGDRNECPKALTLKTKSRRQWSESRVGDKGPRIIKETPRD